MRGNQFTWAAVAAVAVAAGASAQPGPWPTFVNESATRMVAAPALGLSDVEEKNYAWGDVNHDGWTDLVVVRKVLNPAGPRPNVFFMNQSGVLTDRTQRYVKAAMNLPEGVNDQGF